MVTQQILERFLLRILRDLPALDAPVHSSGTANGKWVEITAKPEGWTGPIIAKVQRFSPSERRIVEIVKAHQHPITGFAIWGKLRAAGKNYAMNSVYRSLARLVADGVLHNDHDGSGYVFAGG